MSEATFTIDGDQWVLRCSPRATDMAKQIPSLRYDRKRDAWVGPATLAGALAARAQFGDQLEVSPEAYAYVGGFNEDAALRAQILDVANAAVVRDNYDVDPKAFDFQVGSSLLMSWDHFLNMDDRGNGKTPQALLAMARALHKHHGKGLIVCTKSMLHVWEAEARVFTPDVEPFVIAGTAPQREKQIAAARAWIGPALLIITWSSLTKHTFHAHYGSVKRRPEHTEPGSLNGGWITAVTGDEIHKAKDPKAQQTRALWAVGDTAKVRNGLTATPITKNALDIWPVLRFLDPPSWPSRSKFQDRYVLMTPRWFGDVQTFEAHGLNPATVGEFDRMFRPHSVRRPLQAECKALPPQVRLLEMTPKQKRAYKAMAKRMVAEIDGGIIAATDPLVRDTRLHQIAAAVPVLGEEYEDEDGNLRVDVIGLEEPSCKIDALFEFIDELAGEPLVVFAESRKLIELAYNAITLADGRSAPKGRLVLPQEEVGLITGQVDGLVRASHIDAFQRGDQRLMLATIGAGSEGITLTRSNQLLFLQRSSKMIQNIQAEGRVLRIGQERDVQITDFVTLDTLEYRIHESNDDKEENLQSLVRDEGWTRRNLLKGL